MTKNKNAWYVKLDEKTRKDVLEIIDNNINYENKSQFIRIAVKKLIKEYKNKTKQNEHKHI